MLQGSVRFCRIVMNIKKIIRLSMTILSMLDYKLDNWTRRTSFGEISSISSGVSSRRSVRSFFFWKDHIEKFNMR